jgi:hypothetical protein
LADMVSVFFTWCRSSGQGQKPESDHLDPAETRKTSRANDRWAPADATRMRHRRTTRRGPCKEHVRNATDTTSPYRDVVCRIMFLGCRMVGSPDGPDEKFVFADEFEFEQLFG